MKGLSVEEKSRAYDKAISTIRNLVKAGLIYEDVAIQVFPELIEGEYERIKKAIIEHFAGFHSSMYPYKGFTKKQILAWLEKQGEPVEINPTEFDLRLNKLLKQFETLPKEELVNCLSFYLNVVQNDGTYREEKQCEQKSADKVEPKFKTGDWIVFNGLTLYIKEVVKGYYRTISKGGITNSYDWNIDNAARLWSIQDAKDGDVLYTSPTESSKAFIFIFDHIDALGFIKSYYKYDSEYGLKEDKHLFIGSVRGKYLPATKEQHDLLFSKMKEAGYEWNFLRKRR